MADGPAKFLSIEVVAKETQMHQSATTRPGAKKRKRKRSRQDMEETHTVSKPSSSSAAAGEEVRDRGGGEGGGAAEPGAQEEKGGSGWDGELSAKATTAKDVGAGVGGVGEEVVATAISAEAASADASTGASEGRGAVACENSVNTVSHVNHSAVVRVSIAIGRNRIVRRLLAHEGTNMRACKLVRTSTSTVAQLCTHPHPYLDYCPCKHCY